MIPYIGDISKADAVVLRKLACEATSILEFGCGASTQVMAAYSTCPMKSVETDPYWIETTNKRLSDLDIREIEIVTYQQYMERKGSGYDLIFDDGVDDKRREFAFNAWPLLKIGGKLAFHDTRRTQDVDNIVAFLKQFSPSIRTIEVNKDESNITIFEKRDNLFFQDWNGEEGRELWQIR